MSIVVELIFFFVDLLESFFTFGNIFTTLVKKESHTKMDQKNVFIYISGDKIELLILTNTFFYLLGLSTDHHAQFSKFVLLLQAIIKRCFYLQS